MATTVETEALVTKESFERLPDAFRHYEVSHGELVEVEPVGNMESALATRIACRLVRHLGDLDTWEVMGSDARFRLARDPDLIRGCDVSYVPRGRVPGGRPGSGVGDYVPALAVEIVSPSNRAAEIVGKVSEWFTAGVDLLWVIYPVQRRAYVYDDAETCRILKPGDLLEAPALLPGFEIPVVALFADEGATHQYPSNRRRRLGQTVRKGLPFWSKGHASVLGEVGKPQS